MVDIQLFTMSSNSLFLAYLDPGTGSMVLQVLLASLLGCAMTIKLFWHKIKRFLGFGKGEESTESETSETQSASNETPEN